ncbi:Glucose dehydrogenase [FAD, quinone] [Araneus ventricosus]|uniref:Glucose dehydrogenase [FAD, quinone] n=1 Tax=Araneus ventricosus TaxID=182803 RepID=A0A4Y2KQT2_ARAVE|nr:Glucose dehydrogenase [FAD, quinone] [Araneus ventricosus]
MKSDNGKSVSLSIGVYVNAITKNHTNPYKWNVVSSATETQQPPEISGKLLFITDFVGSCYSVFMYLHQKCRQFPVPRGKGLGGSSLINCMLYVRGNKRDYDQWADNGATGWSWNDVYSYFLKAENNTDPEIAQNGYHSTGGFLAVSSPPETNTLKETFAAAAPEVGYEYKDINGEKQTGFANIQGTIMDGKRFSTAKAYLIPAEHRANLHIVNEAHVHKVLINKNKEAYGVRFENDLYVYDIRALKEVIVSGGSINSPQILMLSGIGPKEHLQNFGVSKLLELLYSKIELYSPIKNNCLQKTFKYDVPFDRNIFNYNNASFEIVKLKKTAKYLCDKDSFSQFIDKDSGNIVTGNLDIVKNTDLKNIMLKGSKFRSIFGVSLPSMLQKLLKNIDDFCLETSNAFFIPIEFFIEWKWNLYYLLKKSYLPPVS